MRPLLRRRRGAGQRTHRVQHLRVERRRRDRRPLDDGAPTAAGKQQAVFHPDNDAQSDWAPDGTKIVYRSRRNNQFEISIVDFTVRDAAGRPAIIDIPKAPDGTQSSQPAWFPDMTGLLYRRTNGAGTTRRDIWAMNLDGTNRRPLYVAPEDQFYPSLSPDMKKLLFSTVKGREARNIQVMDIATGSSRRWSTRARRATTPRPRGRPTVARSRSSPRWTATARSTS